MAKKIKSFSFITLIALFLFIGALSFLNFEIAKGDPPLFPSTCNGIPNCEPNLITTIDSSVPGSLMVDLDIVFTACAGQSDLYVRVDWGDGSGYFESSKYNGSDQVVNISTSHTYSVAGNYQIGSYLLHALPTGADCWMLSNSTQVPLPYCGDNYLDSGEDCDDGNNEDGDGCSSICTTEEQLECTVHADCDDGNVCNGTETCEENTCQPGISLVCDDGNVCTDNSCHSELGCMFENNVEPCDDGDACTVEDVCAQGMCLGGPSMECDDDDICTDDTCNSISGCIFTPNTLCVGPECTEQSINWNQLDNVDIGELISELFHPIAGWSTENIHGSYGGCQDGVLCTYRQLLGELGSEQCTEDERSATTILHTGSNIVDRLEIRHLDGISLLDSYNVYVNEQFIDSWDDVTQVSNEIWRETKFDVSSYAFTGDLEIRLEAIDTIWPQCATYGQVAIDWVSVYGCGEPWNEPYCGDGNTDIGEQCDGDEPQACTTGEGYAGLEMCSECTWTSCESDEYCGDETINGTEQCEADIDCDDDNENTTDICNACICENAPIVGCQPGAIDNCSTGLLGICAAGTRTCTELAVWGECVQDNQPTEEICGNEIDEDCDGSYLACSQEPYCGDGTCDDGECCASCPIDCGECSSGGGGGGGGGVTRYCGDGLLTTSKGEECDDGNKVDGDGCSSTCQTEEVAGEVLGEAIDVETGVLGADTTLPETGQDPFWFLIGGLFILLLAGVNIEELVRN